MKRQASDIRREDDSLKQQQQRRWCSNGKPSQPPAFTDVTASVAAATFCARRLPELQALQQQQNRSNNKNTNQNTTTTVTTTLLDTRGFLSGGGTTSSRHLRRRATSFRPRQRHRNAATTKTTVPTTTTNLSRRAQRRNKANLQQKHSTWATTQSTGTNAGVDATGTTQPVHWIPTHLWHAKRFFMERLWHWQVPLQHTNRGVRAVLRLAQTHPLVQDVTWRTQPVWWQSSGNGDDATAACLRALKRILAHVDDNDNNSLLVPNHRANPDEVLFGQGMLHQIDQHPLGAIGPVSFLVQSKPLVDLGNKKETSLKGSIYVYLWGHASIQQDLWQQVQAMLAQQPSNAFLVQGPFRGVDGGLACLQLNGHNPGKCLAQGLSEVCGTEIQASTLQETFSVNHHHHHHLGINKCVSVEDFACFVTQPRDPSLSCNLGVCGWFVLGSSIRIRELFLQCLLKGSACPIGVLEESALKLEAQPPLAVFPRDYCDTTAGAAYWQPREASSCDWALLRQHDYGSTGRIRRSPLTNVIVKWTNIIEANRIVLVRGSFLKPFLDAWQGLECSVAELSDNATEFCSKTKKRRKVENPTKLRRIPKPSAERRATHESYCERLEQSLTLPAALLCHITVDGPGKIDLGVPLYRYGSDTTEDALLGYATAGSFSPWRGSVHGTAVVCAKSLLAAVGSAHRNDSGVMRPRDSQGPSRAFLLVRVGKEGCVAGLSLLV